MYETYTYDFILNRMLARISSSIDTREGSVIYDALAPAASELAQMYAELDINYNLSFIDTASGEYLTRKCAEFGVNRDLASAAVRQGTFMDSNDSPMDVPIGSWYSIDGLNFEVIGKARAGIFKLQCETSGIIGNNPFGVLLPVYYIEGLANAELTDVLVPGEDEETDNHLRTRFYEFVNEPTFGGNVADYKQYINSLDGVGGTKVFPVWDGGGTVKCAIISSAWAAPSLELIEEIQTLVDPEINSGAGVGMAPIGHSVTITGVEDVTVNIETAVTLAVGVSIGQVQEDIESAIGTYLLELRQEWVNSQVVVRVAQIDARILAVEGVEDVTDTEINGVPENITLGSEEIPQLGAVTVNE